MKNKPKSINVLLMIAIMMAIYTPSYSWEEDVISEPCTPDCVTSQWSPVNIIRVHLQRLHKVDVYYVTRKACGYFQDVQILGISSRRYKCPGMHLQYMQTPEQEFQAILAAIIKVNQMGFNPQTNTIGCSNVWRVSNRSCWATFEIVIYDENAEEIDRYNVKIPCEDADCCMAQVKVCRTATNHITVQALDPTVITNCDSYSYTNTTSSVPCAGNCSWIPQTETAIDGLIEGFEPIDMGIFTPPLLKSNVSEGNTMELGVNTFVTDNAIHFQLYSKFINNVNIELYNINGQKLFEGKYNLTDGINDLYIENKYNNTNIILYSITKGNKKLNSGKILNK